MLLLPGRFILGLWGFLLDDENPDKKMKLVKSFALDLFMKTQGTQQATNLHL